MCCCLSRQGQAVAVCSFAWADCMRHPHLRVGRLVDVHVSIDAVEEGDPAPYADAVSMAVTSKEQLDSTDMHARSTGPAGGQAATAQALRVKAQVTQPGHLVGWSEVSS